tara:strand:- start:112 stop:822 length:711 start_codon:yes stop_codon:yes gene_type:complete
MNDEVKTVVILAGGKGTRMREETEFIPKPMVTIGGIPILEHLINYFSHYKKFNFVICTGYKENIIIDYFNELKRENIFILPTGEDTNTGGRIAMVKDYVSDNFIMTYGDGLSDININKLIDFHFSHNKIGTISTTKPLSRFGLVDFKDSGEVIAFTEKPLLDSYVNMGYMVFNKEIFKFIDGDEIFENEPLKKLAKNKEIFAFAHSGFFRPMDTYREYLELNQMWEDDNAPWKIKF